MHDLYSILLPAILKTLIAAMVKAQKERKSKPTKKKRVCELDLDDVSGTERTKDN